MNKAAIVVKTEATSIKTAIFISSGMTFLSRDKVMPELTSTNETTKAIQMLLAVVTVMATSGQNPTINTKTGLRFQKPIKNMLKTDFSDGFSILLVCRIY